jgi:SecY interacting protein Syd
MTRTFGSVILLFILTMLLRKVMNQEVSDALDGFVHRLLQKVQSEKIELLIEFDSQWPSTCYLQQANEGEEVNWLPVRQSHQMDWSAFETALDIVLHPSIKDYFGCYWSDNLAAKHEFGQLELIQVWNEADFERLQQNLIGHILMKRRLKQSETLFFALTDEEDEILCINNVSGEVVLEQVGLEPKRVIASNLASFILAIEPCIKKRST